jgi:outer membrane biosynthesis protein TonB
VQVALRLPAPDVAKAREIAGRKGIGYQTLIKMLVHISQVAPEYPQAARKAGVEGVVKLDAVVGRDGHVKNVKIVEGKKGVDGGSGAGCNEMDLSTYASKR